MATPAVAPMPTGFKPDPDIINEFQRLMHDQYETHKRAIADAVAQNRTEISVEFKAELEKRDAAIQAVAAKSSRPPVSLGLPGMEYRSVGQQLIEHEGYKALQAATPGRPHLSLTIKGRVVPAFEQRAINPFISAADAGLTFAPRRVGVYAPAVVPLVMRDLMDVIPLDSGNAIEYVTETFTNNADYQVLEGDKKAQSDLTYTPANAYVRTIAHYMKVSRQMLADAPFIRVTIDNKLTYGIAAKEDKEILYGDNSAGHLQGVMPIATAYNAGSLPVANPIDQMYAAMMQVMTAGYAPSAIVLNPVAFAGMALLKNETNGSYLLGGPPATEATPRLWGVPVALTMNMAPTEFLVGAFPGNAALFDREQTTVEMATENEDDFIRNLVTVRAEERIALAWFVPQAFVKGTVMTPAPLGGAATSAPSRPPEQKAR